MTKSSPTEAVDRRFVGVAGGLAALIHNGAESALKIPAKPLARFIIRVLAEPDRSRTTCHDAKLENSRSRLLAEAKAGIVALDGDHGLTVSVSGPTASMRQFTARYVVDATGCRSGVARQAGAWLRVLDRLTFIYGFFDTSRADVVSKLTLLEADELGWWYAACLPGQRLAVAFASDPDIVRDRKFTLARDWLERLSRTQHLAARVQGCRLQSDELTVRVAPTTCLDHVSATR